MEMGEIFRQIEDLRRRIEEHNHRYYVLSQPTISDFEFDALMRELQDLEEKYPEFADENSPTKRVGSDINKSFRQVRHDYPMLSLGNTYSSEEVAAFYQRVQKALGEEFEIVCELKYDGTSISLIYENGALVRAVTRGDGEQGDDITDNVRTIRTIPLRVSGEAVPKKFEVRGEILMPWEVFEKLNLQREKNGEQLFANPRNATSGTIKLQNSAQVAKRGLDAYIYYFLGEELPFENHFENINFLKKIGFKVAGTMEVCRSLEEIFAFIKKWDVERKNLPFATDGIVLKVNNLAQQSALGLTAKLPRWAIAYKFQAERAESVLESVAFQIGRTGAVTPVANLTPVLLSGTTVRRASLHNADVIASLDLHIGDTVFVEKGGEIIPKIVGVNLEKRLLGATAVAFPETCPECSSALIRQSGEAAHFCPNIDGCPPQIKGRIEHFVSRKAMDIEFLGAENINQLFERGLIADAADLYDLKSADLLGLEGWAQKSVENLFSALERSRSVPFERVLFALGIPLVGQEAAKKLATAFGSVEKLATATSERLCQENSIGEQIAQSVISFFLKEKNQTLISRLKAQGLQFECEEKSAPISEKLLGKSFVISGVFQQYSREQYKAMIEQNGGRNVSAISAKTDFVLAGENMGPAKLEKASSLGVKIISEVEFLEMLN